MDQTISEHMTKELARCKAIENALDNRDYWQRRSNEYEREYSQSGCTSSEAFHNWRNAMRKVAMYDLEAASLAGHFIS